jgi:hypothetical protein
VWPSKQVRIVDPFRRRRAWFGAGSCSSPPSFISGKVPPGVRFSPAGAGIPVLGVPAQLEPACQPRRSDGGWGSRRWPSNIGAVSASSADSWLTASSRIMLILHNINGLACRGR